jgi:hypothetical protein
MYENRGTERERETKRESRETEMRLNDKYCNAVSKSFNILPNICMMNK